MQSKFCLPSETRRLRFRFEHTKQATHAQLLSVADAFDLPVIAFMVMVSPWHSQTLRVQINPTVETH